MSDIGVHHILGVRVNDISTDDLVTQLKTCIGGDRSCVVVTPNPEFVLAAQTDFAFRDILSRADLALPDGVGLKYAVAALSSDEELVHRHTGGDTLALLARLCGEEKKRILILGGNSRDNEQVSQLFKKVSPELDIVSCDPGIVDDEYPRLSEATMSRVRLYEPVVIAVALGQGRGRQQGKQEKIMEALKELPTVRVIIGVGGAVHAIANPHLQAPEKWRKRGLEWMWRLLQQPWRFKRILRATVLFPLEVAWATLKSRRFLSACRRVVKELRRHASA